jgi:hypothetical protein
MINFFSALKGKFSAEFDGRYLALILQEIGNRHPKPLISFICEVLDLPLRKFQRAHFQTEYQFRGSGSTRFADLAVFAGEDDEPCVLIEIKYFDKPQVGNDTKPAQLKDYVAWKKSIKGDSRSVMIISREMIIEDGIANRRWRQLARHLKQYHKQSDLIDMLVDYLEEEGVVMRSIESKSLLGFFKRILCGPKGSSVLANNLKGPLEFSSLLKNMRLLSVPFDRHFKAAWSSAGKKVDDDYSKSSRIATIDYVIQNRCNTNDINKLLDEKNIVTQSAKDGGVVTVFARYSLGHGKDQWLRIEYGFYFEIDSKSSKDNLPITRMYAMAYGGPLKAVDDPYVEKKIDFNIITSNAEESTEQVEKLVNTFLQQVLATLLESKLKLNAQQKTAIKLLLKSLST